MTDESATTSPDSALPRPGPPPLRIHHLLLWTIVAATLLTQLSLQRASRNDWGNSETDWALIAVTQVITAAGFTVRAISFYWYAKGYDAFSQPGQWLTLLLLYNVLESWLFWAMPGLGSGGSFRPKSILPWNLSDVPAILGSFRQSVVAWGIPAFIYAIASRRGADTRPWRGFLVLSAFGLTVQTISTMVWTACEITGIGVAAYVDLMQTYFSPTTLQWLFYSGPWVLGAVLLAWATIDDRVRDRPRYWTHWAGALLSLALRAVVIARILIQ